MLMHRAARKSVVRAVKAAVVKGVIVRAPAVWLAAAMPPLLMAATNRPKPLAKPIPPLSASAR